VAVGLVHAEHERPRDSVARHDAFELVVVAGHSVDVVAEVQVRVEDLRIRRQLAAQLGIPFLDQLPRPRDRIHSSQSR
jgi:hypothetical protein